MRGCTPPFVRPLLGVLLTAGLTFVLTAANGQLKKPDNHGLPQGVQDLKIGDAAPDFSLPGIDGKKHTLGEYRDASVLMIAFISNHCPDSHAALGRIEKLADELKDKSFQLVAINPNNPDGLSIDELGYSKYNDSLEDMKKYAAEAAITFPYLYDGDTQSVAKAYGCLATPHVFVFDAQRKLRYKGEFDNSRYPDPATVTAHEAQDAVEALLDYKPVPVEVTKPHGCSTKWMEKKPKITQATEKWAKAPVDVERIDMAGVAALRKNDSGKLRLINIWATWCAPCVAEFPDLVSISRQFSRRDFEMITISVDDPNRMPQVKAFLEKQGASVPPSLKPALQAEGRKTNSYLFQGADVDALMKRLDPEWPGGVPHTVLIAPDGKIVWRHTGAVDSNELRAKIVDVLGPYYKP